MESKYVDRSKFKIGDSVRVVHRFIAHSKVIKVFVVEKILFRSNFEYVITNPYFSNKKLMEKYWYEEISLKSSRNILTEKRFIYR